MISRLQRATKDSEVKPWTEPYSVIPGSIKYKHLCASHQRFIKVYFTLNLPYFNL